MLTTMEPTPPDLMVDPGPEGVTGAPVRRISSTELRVIGARLMQLFQQYKTDRQETEQRWLRNLRQYKGQYDPEVEKAIGSDRSMAYPRMTRVKCISVLSRVMNLMFPGNERNWELTASPQAEMDPNDVMEAVEELLLQRQQAGLPGELTDEMVQHAAQRLAAKRAETLSVMIDDQLQEIGGDQSKDFIGINRKVVKDGILYGVGVVRGPFVKKVPRVEWKVENGQPVQVQTMLYKPVLEVLPVWDFYPDISAKSLLSDMDGYFMRMVMTRAQVRDLARRDDFFGDQIREYLTQRTSGNYRPQTFETQLREMGLKVNVNDNKTSNGRYEIIVWSGMMSGAELKQMGVEVPDDQIADDLEAEVWMLDDWVIKADINAYRQLGMSVRTIHSFVFDEDDTGPIGDGLPNVVRDSQMSLSAATRMLLDNASIVCGPNIEVNRELLSEGQDISSIRAYKVWYREGTGPEASMPAVRNLPFDAHMDELLKLVDLFSKFADAETFVGPATGGDVQNQPSEPMRTAAGASMVRGDAALPFKDIIRNFDAFTQSILTSLMQFNRKFNAERMPQGDFNVIARGATSLIAKEVRGMQLDQLAVSMTPEERMHIDERKFVEQRLASRDLAHLLVPIEEAKQRMQTAQQATAAQTALQEEQLRAEVRKTMADAFKGIAQGQKNSAGADAAAVKSALELLTAGLDQEAAATAPAGEEA
jgi:hypothetical protein